MRIAIANDDGQDLGAIALGPDAQVIPLLRIAFGPTAGEDSEVIESFLAWLAVSITHGAASAARREAGRKAKRAAENAVADQLPPAWGDLLDPPPPNTEQEG